MPLALDTSLLACLHPTARLACLLVFIVGAAHVLVVSLRQRRLRWPIAIAWIALLGLAGWFGSFRYSPLDFGSAARPVLRSFEIRRPGRGLVTVAPGQVISAAPGLPLSIHPQTLPVPIECLWSASAGGALDDPHSCDTAYAAPASALFEILRLRVRPACGLPASVAQIKISILP